MAVQAKAPRQSTRRLIGHIAGVTFSYLLLLVVAAVTIGPFIFMISASITPNLSFLYFPMPLIPAHPTLDNYFELFRLTMIGRWILNSIFVATSVTILQAFTSSLAGFAFARGDWLGRDAIFWMLMAWLMVPGTVTIVPLFILLSRFHWTDTYTGLIVPGATSVFGVFLMRQYFTTIPRDYDDAALMDGAGLWRIYLSVILPLGRPALATLATLTFLAIWNDFLYPLIMTTRDIMRPLTVGLATMVVQGGGAAGVSMAGATVTFLPTFFIFLVMQRYVVQGIALTGVKG